MGMCPEPFNFKLEVQKQVPGGNGFATVGTNPKVMRGDGDIGICQQQLSAICNCNREAPIRFALVDLQTNNVFNTF